MTGLSVLFNMNTEEACYIYGNMDSYRRLNEQSIQDRYSGGLSGKYCFNGHTTLKQRSVNIDSAP